MEQRGNGSLAMPQTDAASNLEGETMATTVQSQQVYSAVAWWPDCDPSFQVVGYDYARVASAISEMADEAEAYYRNDCDCNDKNPECLCQESMSTTDPELFDIDDLTTETERAEILADLDTTGIAYLDR